MPRGEKGNRKCRVKGRKGWISLKNCGTVALFVFPVGVARIAWQFVLRCSEQHGMFMAAGSANPVATSMEPITRTSSHVIVGSYALADFSIRLVLGHFGKVIWSEPRLHFGLRVPIGIAHLTFHVNSTAKQLCLRIALSVRVRRSSSRLVETHLHSRFCGPDDVDALQVRAEG